MVAPLEVKLVVALEHIHDYMRSGATVVYIAENMQPIDTETLNHVAHGDDKGIGASGGDYCLYDTVVIRLLVLVAR